MSRDDGGGMERIMARPGDALEVVGRMGLEPLVNVA
jgi:hypothetical protein